MVFEWAADKGRKEGGGGERRMNSAQGRSDANDYLEKRREGSGLTELRMPPEFQPGEMGSGHFNCEVAHRVACFGRAR